jgi:hypothetical protein
MMLIRRVIPQSFHTGPNHSTRGALSIAHTISQRRIISIPNCALRDRRAVLAYAAVIKDSPSA